LGPLGCRTADLLSVDGRAPGGRVWSFVVVDDATNTILMTDYSAGNVSNPSGVWGTQAQAAGATGITTWDGATQLSATSTAGFTDSLTLAQPSTLDFFIIDYYLPDNSGGVALNIDAPSDVPEPWSLVVLPAPLIALGLARRLHRSLPAQS
jgi:hypothetical protein